jgi:hypothetical protein
MRLLTPPAVSRLSKMARSSICRRHRQGAFSSATKSAERYRAGNAAAVAGRLVSNIDAGNAKDAA